ncbi:MAG: hypothetical protein JWN95_2021 [Frankiales bacterium]|nr:hypothetical protein [Frankiales bacterium]
MRRLIVLILSIAAILSVASSAQAAPSKLPVPPGGASRVSVAQAMTALKGKTLGPNRYTAYGRATIAGWRKSGRYEVPVLRTSYPGVVAVKPLPGTSISPNSWYNPTTWDWGHILGATWNAVWSRCLKGALKGVVGTASGTLLINLAARGGTLFIGPWGYAALAIGGCTVDAVFG